MIWVQSEGGNVSLVYFDSEEEAGIICARARYKNLVQLQDKRFTWGLARAVFGLFICRFHGLNGHSYWHEDPNSTNDDALELPITRVMPIKPQATPQ